MTDFEGGRSQRAQLREIWGWSGESRQGTEQTRTFDPTNESVDCWLVTQL